MKIVIEVVATNMDSGHIAISQETVETGANIPQADQHAHIKHLISSFEKDGTLNAYKVGPILIKRSIIVLAD